MANKNFVVKNGLTVGNLDIDAITGNLITAGNVSANILLANQLLYPNGTPYSSAVTVGVIYANNSLGNTFTGVSTIRFDDDSGFDVTQITPGEIKVAMNSTFKTWVVDGSSNLVASGLDTVEFIAGNNIVITTNANSAIKSIKFDYQGETGYTGSQGTTGFVGSQGATGFVGSQGIGYVGSQGTTGFVGSQGISGFTGSIGYTGSKGDTGLSFQIAKTYASVAALTADTAPTGIVAGQFAIIDTGNVENADNSKIYLWNGSSYTFINDLSGSAGIKGDTGFVGSQGPVGFVGSRGVATNWTTVTANYTAQNADRLIANTTAGTFTITLPATPIVGHYVEIADGNNFFTNSLYVNRNGSTIESQASDLEINIPGVNVQFLYDGSTWQIITTAGITGNVGYTGSKGNPGGNGYSIQEVTSSMSLTANVKVLVNTNTANITLTLPTVAGFGDEVFVIDGTGNASVHAITIARNGHRIQGLNEDMTVSTNRAAFGLTYYNATHGWVLNNV